MKLLFSVVITASVLVLSCWTSSVFADGPYTDPEKTDEDFAFQGEYVGELKGEGDETQKFGLQVVALGKGKFKAVGFHGGLPGDGWDGEEPMRIEEEGTRKNDTVSFSDKHGKGIIKDGAVTVKSPDGKPMGELKKVHRKSPTLGEKAPQGAAVLFDGSNADQWVDGKMTDDGLLQQGTTSKQKFGSHKLHIEFLIPYQPEARGQGRGNSGIYVQGRYEVQMLDSFGLEGKMNECGGLYSVADCDLNMCYPPLSWQTFDIEYTAANFDDGKLTKNPRITVKHNGVTIHDDVELPGERNTTAAPSKPGPEPGPVYLQNHGNPVRYRNIWVVEEDK